MKDSNVNTLPQVDADVNSPQPVEVKVPDFLCIMAQMVGKVVGCHLIYSTHYDCEDFKSYPAWQKMAEKEAQR
jgi:hypothetical protein